MTPNQKSFSYDLPDPPEDSVEVYVEIDEEDVHFLDAVIDGYDGVANVRREYKLVNGDSQFLIYTSPGFLEFTVNIVRELREYIYIGKIVVNGDEVAP